MGSRFSCASCLLYDLQQVFHLCAQESSFVIIPACVLTQVETPEHCLVGSTYVRKHSDLFYFVRLVLKPC